MKTGPFQYGFTLIEIAIVLLVVTILLGYSVAMFPIQQELKQYREVDQEMNSIIEHLIGYAQVNGRLPCPDSDADGLENTSDGFDNTDGSGGGDGIVDGCVSYYGALPSGDLGMNGDINANGQLQDPWGGFYGYAISNVDISSNNVVDLVSPNGIREEGLTDVVPDLFVCDDSTTAGDHTDCTPATIGDEVAGNVAVVIVSLGKEFSLPPPTNIQIENTDDFGDGKNDKVFVHAPRSEAYDDVVKWISTSLLYSKMIEADQLP